MTNPLFRDPAQAISRIWTILNQWFVTASGVSFTPLVGTATWDPGAIANGAMESKDVTVTGAALGDPCFASFSIDIVDLVISAACTLADVVTVTLANNTGGSVNLASGTVRAVAFHVGAETLNG